jgi:hypothetical protein
MLLCAGSVLLTLGMVTLAMMFSGGTMRLGSVFVVFGCLVVFVSCHLKPRLLLASQPASSRQFSNCSYSCDALCGNCFHWRRAVQRTIEFQKRRKSNMTGHMPPIPPANRSTKGPKPNADQARDTSVKESHTENTAEQGDTANIKQNTTNAGFFKGRRVK